MIVNGTAAPMNSQGQTTAPPVVLGNEAVPRVEPPPASEPDAFYLLSTLLVGGTLEVTNLLLTRARLWRTSRTAEPKLLPAPEDETTVDLLRYALIGLLIESTHHLHDQTLWWGDLLLRSAGKAATVTRPVTRSWLLAPVRPFLVALAQRGESELARLIHQGRLEETASRLLTRELTDDMVTLVIAYLSDKPEVRRLIQEQGFSLAGEVVDEVRDRSKTADAQIETLVHRLFRRAPRTPAAPPPA
jgi:hypothetical protein